MGVDWVLDGGLVLLIESKVLSFNTSDGFDMPDGVDFGRSIWVKSNFSMKFSLFPSLNDATVQHDPFCSPNRQHTSSGSTHIVNSTGRLRST